MFGRIPQWSHLVLNFCLQGGFVFFFFITDSISLLVIGQFKLSISSWFTFGGLYVSRNLFISFRLSKLLAYNCSYNCFYASLYFCGIGYLSFFISYFVYLGPLSFLLGEPGQRFVNFVCPFKKPDLGFIDFFYCYFYLYFIYFLSLLFLFFCWH